MRNDSQTLIGIIREHVVAWRKRDGLSREKVVQYIVDTHARIGGAEATDISFDPPGSRDSFDYMKVNADRVFRWLDDETKETNHLPANFIPSILAAMPEEIRLQCVDQFLLPLGLGARFIGDPTDDELNVGSHLYDMIESASKAQLAVASLLTGKDRTALEHAYSGLTDAIEKKTRVRRLIEAAIFKAKAGANRVKSVIHLPKRRAK